jgi:SAM-dependent methyltransferase
MKGEVYNFIKTCEKNNWWYKARRFIFEKILKDYAADFPKSGKLYEIGCAYGGNFGVWSKFSDFCVGVDVKKECLESCKNLGYKEVILANAEDLAIIPSSVASVVVACDVLEHIENDEKALREMRRILKKGGILFLTAPAFEFLWGGADKLSLHKRRYSKRELEGKLKDAGFSIVRSAYFNTFLFLPVLISRILEKMLKLNPAIEYKPLPRFLNYILEKIFSFEAYLLKFLNFPFGVSLMIIAKSFNY